MGTPIQKIDFRKTMPHLYAAKPASFVLVDVPAMRFVMVDGAGDPNTAPAFAQALEWLYSTSYAMKFAAKADLHMDYVVPPLEGLWWADDPADFVARRKDCWRWAAMIMVPDFVTTEMFDSVQTKTAKKLGAKPPSFRFETFQEGLSLQTLHIGSYDDEGPTLAHLHDVVMPSMGFTFAGHHHEIYLSDARKTEPSKRKTILRQPVKAVGEKQ